MKTLAVLQHESIQIHQRTNSIRNAICDAANHRAALQMAAKHYIREFLPPDEVHHIGDVSQDSPVETTSARGQRRHRLYSPLGEPSGVHLPKIFAPNPLNSPLLDSVQMAGECAAHFLAQAKTDRGSIWVAKRRWECCARRAFPAQSRAGPQSTYIRSNDRDSPFKTTSTMLRIGRKG